MADNNFDKENDYGLKLENERKEFIFVDKNNDKDNEYKNYEYKNHEHKNHNKDEKCSNKNDYHCKCDKHNGLKDSLSEIVESISIQEDGLANILDSEALKVCKAVEVAECIDDLVKVNKSVKDTIKYINRIQLLLLGKLEKVSDMCDECK